VAEEDRTVAAAVAVKTSVDASLPAVVNAALGLYARATVAGPTVVHPIPQRHAVARRTVLPMPQQRAVARRMAAVPDHMVADRMAAANANSQYC